MPMRVKCFRPLHPDNTQLIRDVLLGKPGEPVECGRPSASRATDAVKPVSKLTCELRAFEGRCVQPASPSAPHPTAAPPTPPSPRIEALGPSRQGASPPINIPLRRKF